MKFHPRTVHICCVLLAGLAAVRAADKTIDDFDPISPGAATGDELLIYDISASAPRTRKITVGNLSLAILASPALTGTPTAPTAAGGTNTTQLATTAFTTAAISSERSAARTLTNVTLSGASNTITVRLANDVTGTLPVANGGTGQTSLGAAINALVPTQSGHTGEYLQTNGSAVGWAAAAGGGSAIDQETAATLSPSGNDGTAVLGDPGHPYATAQAAIDDGATALVVLPGGTYGDFTVNGGTLPDAKLGVYGFGGSSQLGNITQIGGVIYTGNGAGNIKVASINALSPDPGTPGQTLTVLDLTVVASLEASGSVGSYAYVPGSGGQITARRCDLSNCTITANGGNGFNPGPNASGNSGGTLTLEYCILQNVTASAVGGNGADGADDGSGNPNAGGNGGTGGVIYTHWCEVNAYVSYDSGGGGGIGYNGGGDGSSGSSGSGSSFEFNY